MGGMGNLNATGLGSFLNAGTDPFYDPLLVQGLQVTEQAITHVAGDWDTKEAKQLIFSTPQNMDLWADWVRGSLYLTNFLRDLDWKVHGYHDSDEQWVTLGYRDRPAHPDPWSHPAAATTFYKVFRPDAACFKQQLQRVRDYLDQRPDRAAEIITQLGFPTPYFMMILGLQAAPNRFTMELITLTQVLAAHTVMQVKHHLACRRPDKIGAKVMPMIPTPAHGSFPSAHATEAFAVAEVLKGLIYSVDHYPDRRKRRRLINKLAERIAVNRTVAGLHFPIDTWAGAILGRAVGQLVLAKCGVEAAIDAYEYRAEGESDFFIHDFANDDDDEDDDDKYDKAKRREAGAPGVTQTGSFNICSSGIFAWLWEKARKEFDLTR